MNFTDAEIMNRGFGDLFGDLLLGAKTPRAYPFPEEQVYVVIDYETFSEVDLKKVGGFEYALHDSTDILCVAWRIGTRATLRTAPIKTWTPALDGTTMTGTLVELGAALSNADHMIVAHNALFEQVITKYVLKRRYLTGLRPLPPTEWVCTAALSATLALPRNLAGVGAALRLPVQKDVDGHKLMLKWCKPRKQTTHDFTVRHTDPNELRRIVAYCIVDVDSETLVFLKVPPLTPTERRVWELDQAINLRGFAVDRTLVCKALDMIEIESARLARETELETMGLITSGNQRGAILEWLKTEGVFLPNLQKGTVEDAISSGLVTGSARTVLQFRQASAKTSTAKYVAFEQRSRYDSRLRDILSYHAASTGRWGGAGVQPQNFPRGTLKNSIQAAEVIATGDLELLRMLYGEPMAVLSSCLRNAIVAPPGKTLDVADYNAIEARVLAWVADHKEGIAQFREGRKLYEELAAGIFGIPAANVNADQRWLGKTAKLGCGYQMGWKKFQATCANNGKTISDELAQQAVTAYRDSHAEIVQLWDTINRAAIAAVDNVGTRYSVNRTTWYVKSNFLWCILPSGRRLAYAYPTVEFVETPWGEKRKTLHHYGVDSVSKKWVKQKTYGGKLVENVVQAISRDLMAEAMLRIEATGVWQIVLTVHDELVAERAVFIDMEGSDFTNQTFCSLMEKLPPWATGCPVKAEGWSGARYRK